MARADHSLIITCFTCAMTLAGVYNAGVLKIQVSHQVGGQVGIQAVKMHLHKELFNCPEAL